MCMACLDRPENELALKYDSEWGDTVIANRTVVLLAVSKWLSQYTVVDRGREKATYVHPKDDGFVFIRWLVPEH